jgi:hypothetical protein
VVENTTQRPIFDSHHSLQEIWRNWWVCETQADHDQTTPAERTTDENQRTQAMAEPQIRDQIIGLIAVKEHRGLSGESAIAEWVTSALAILLRAELERIEREKKNV